jgi:hypothetical protein
MDTQTDTQNVDQLPPLVVSLPDPDVPKDHPEECDEFCGGADVEADGGETGTAGDPTADLLHADLNALHDDAAAPQADVPAELKSQGNYAFALVAPEGRDDIKYTNYDPREFILVHQEVWNDVTTTADEATSMAKACIQLDKELRAQKRGMRKVNKHWSATKRELRQARKEYENLVKNNADLLSDMEGLWADDRKRGMVFANRLARRLRKARAGRDKRERQVNQVNALLTQANAHIASQDAYIKHLEQLAYGRR